MEKKRMFLLAAICSLLALLVPFVLFVFSNLSTLIGSIMSKPYYTYDAVYNILRIVFTSGLLLTDIFALSICLLFVIVSFALFLVSLKKEKVMLPAIIVAGLTAVLVLLAYSAYALLYCGDGVNYIVNLIITLTKWHVTIIYYIIDIVFTVLISGVFFAAILFAFVPIVLVILALVSGRKKKEEIPQVEEGIIEQE